MDFVKNLAGGNKEEGSNQHNQQTQNTSEQKSSGGWMDKLNTAAGGGRESEKNEDYLDKGGHASLIVCYLRSSIIPFKTAQNLKANAFL